MVRANGQSMRKNFSFLIATGIMLHCYFTPTFLLQLLPLTVLLLYSTPCAAELACSAVLPPENVPQPAHCRHILSHLPSLPALANNRFQSPSAPFSFEADYLHQSCSIRFSHYPIAARFRQSLTDTSAREVWTGLRDSAARIVETCVETQKTGYAHEFPPDLDLFYVAQVDRSRESLLRASRNQGQALDRFGIRDRRIEERPFWNPIYLV